MNSINKQIKNIAESVFINESDAIKNLIYSINEDFISSVNLILKSKGRVIVTGIGKSAIIAQKIVATLNSTGTPSVYMHAADAIHGDLGLIQKDDVVICISKSGNTPEIKVLVPFIKNFGNLLIALTANNESFLSKQADYTLLTPIKKEACPNNLAPTTSTTAQLAMGDALAVCLLKLKSFTEKDFAKYHPGGSLGKKLYLRVLDIYPNNEKPEVNPDTSFQDVLIEISSKRLGATVVIKNNVIEGIITDGDLRRFLQANTDLKNITAKDIMHKNPKTIKETEMAINAYELMKKNSISQLIVVDEKNNYKGMIHIHDLMKEGIV
jgi:arabinose-5-phosphate isomerase